MTNRNTSTHSLIRPLAIVFTFALLVTLLVFIFVKWDGRFFSNTARTAFLILSLCVLISTVLIWIYQFLPAQRQSRIQSWILRFLFENRKMGVCLFYTGEVLLASTVIPLACLVLGFNTYLQFLLPLCLLGFLTSLTGVIILGSLQKQHASRPSSKEVRDTLLLVSLTLYIGYVLDRFLNESPFSFFKLDLSSLGMAPQLLSAASTLFTMLFLLNIAILLIFIVEIILAPAKKVTREKPAQKSIIALLLFVGILALGILVRVWDWQNLPLGLNQDEASAGVDAYSILHFGTDRNGVSFPIYFQGFGNGATPLYTYLLVPFVALGGLTVSMVRLPALIFGILTLPLVYWIGRRLRNRETGLLAMFLLAICPWHILMSRWGLDCNLLPFVFAVGFIYWLRARNDNHLIIPALFFFGLCFYAYASAYVAVPLFLAAAIPLLLRRHNVRKRDLVVGLILFFVLISPIAAYLAVNIFNLPTLHLGSLTILHLPSATRFEHESILFGGNVAAGALKNLSQIPGLFFTQTDDLVYNVVEPYGFIYIFTTPLFLIGLWMLLFQKPRECVVEFYYLAAWILAPLLVGAIEQPNIHRLNLIFIPILLCLAVLLERLRTTQWRLILVIMAGLLTAFGFFNKAYHGEVYKQQIGEVFFDGFLPAVSHAAESSDGPICVTDKANMPYIYTLFADPISPAQFTASRVIADPDGEWQIVQSYDRYTFGLDHCEIPTATAFVLHKYEALPENAVYASRMDYGNYSVYLP